MPRELPRPGMSPELIRNLAARSKSVSVVALSPMEYRVVRREDGGVNVEIKGRPPLFSEHSAYHYSCVVDGVLNLCLTMIRASWTTGISIEATLELWASALRDVKGRVRPLFTQERVAASAGTFLDGLLGAERRKTGWMRAEAAGDPGPWRQQAVLGRGRWDADALRDVVREYALETLADPVLFWSSMRPASSSRARLRAGCIASPPARPARSRTARSVCLQPTPLGTVMPSSIGPCTCPRPGPRIRPGWPPPTCRRGRPSRPSRDWLWR